MRQIELFASLVLVAIGLVSAGEAEAPASHLVATRDFEGARGGHWPTRRRAAKSPMR